MQNERREELADLHVDTKSFPHTHSPREPTLLASHGQVNKISAQQRHHIFYLALSRGSCDLSWWCRTLKETATKQEVAPAPTWNCVVYDRRRIRLSSNSKAKIQCPSDQGDRLVMIRKTTTTRKRWRLPMKMNRKTSSLAVVGIMEIVMCVRNALWRRVVWAAHWSQRVVTHVTPLME